MKYLLDECATTGREITGCHFAFRAEKQEPFSLTGTA
jgi:hypothetical protein